MITDIQKASMLKRIAAGIFDAILFITLAVGMVWMLTEIVNYDSYHQAYQSDLSAYEEQFGVSFDGDYSTPTEEQTEKIHQTVRYAFGLEPDQRGNPLTESQRSAIKSQVEAALSEKNVTFSGDYKNLSAEHQTIVNNVIMENAMKAANADASLTKNFRIVMSLTLVTITFGLFLAALILEFVIPLVLKNGQTVGKKIFSIGLVRLDGVQLTPLQLFVRSILGKFTIEIMIPVYIIIMLFFGFMGAVGILVLFAILLLQIILLITSRTNSLIHDTMAGTVAVDIASQMIFRSTDDLIAYQKKVHAEQAARSNY